MKTTAGPIREDNKVRSVNKRTKGQDNPLILTIVHQFFLPCVTGSTMVCLKLSCSFLLGHTDSGDDTKSFTPSLEDGAI